MKAVIIDDNIQNIEVLAQLLSIEDVEVIKIPDSTLIMNFLDEIETADVVFLDLEMPELTGTSVKSLLKQHTLITPIIAYSAHHDKKSFARFIGFDGFLSKPLNVEKFPDQLSCILRGDQVWD